MTEFVPGQLLRVFVSESDRFGHVPLYEAIVQKARDLGLAGATVLHGRMGFGVHATMHTSKILRLADDLPIVVEIVDAKDAIARLRNELDNMMEEGFVTLEDVKILRYTKED